MAKDSPIAPAEGEDPEFDDAFDMYLKTAWAFIKQPELVEFCFTYDDEKKWHLVVYLAEHDAALCWMAEACKQMADVMQADVRERKGPIEILRFSSFLRRIGQEIDRLNESPVLPN